jgi:DNA repair exonuclease SbcCD ATPase subunit
MDHWRRSNGAFAALGWFADRQSTEVAAPFHSKRQGSGAMTPGLLSFWLALLLGSVAIDQSKADDGLAPQNRERSVQIPKLSDIQTGPAAGEQLQALGQERSKAEASRRELAKARTELLLKLCKDADARKTGGEREENLRRELAAARLELSAMRGVKENTCTQVGADPINKQGSALEQQRQIAEGLASDLALAQRAFERLKTEAVAAHDAAEASLAGMRQALEEERRKAGLLQRDLAATRQSIGALETSARLAATTQADAMQGRQLAEAAARQASEALALERERASSLATDLETARRERDAAKVKLTQISEALEKAWEQEHEKAVGLARDLVRARKDIDALKSKIERRSAGNKNTAKARSTDDASARAEQRKSAPRQKVGAQMRKPQGVRLTTNVLPDELLPTQPPLKGFRQ